MIEAKSVPRAGENVWLWLLKVLTGLGIVVLLFIHLVVNHFVAREGLLTHAEVVAYYTNPWVVLMEGVFLLFVVSHSLIGTRSILLDLNPSRPVLKALDVTLILIGAVSTVYGLWLLQVVVRMG